MRTIHLQNVSNNKVFLIAGFRAARKPKLNDGLPEYAETEVNGSDESLGGVANNSRHFAVYPAGQQQLHLCFDLRSGCGCRLQRHNNNNGSVR